MTIGTNQSDVHCTTPLVAFSMTMRKKTPTNACYLINFIVAPSNELQKRITSTHIIELSTIISLTNVITHEYCLFSLVFLSFSFLSFHSHMR